MSILSNVKVNKREKISKDKILELVNTRIKTFTTETFKHLINVHQKGIDILWNHPQLSPQEIIDILNDDAVKIFQFHGELADFIHKLAEIENIEINLESPTNDFTIDLITNKITVLNKPYTKR